MEACQVCGKQNPAGVEYCEDCGAALAGASQPASGGTAAPASATTPGAPPETPPSPSTPAGSAGAGASVAGAAPAAPGSQSGPPPTPSGTADGPGATATSPVPAPAGADPSAAPPMAGTGQRPRLVVQRYGAPTGEEIPLAGERLVVGRFDPETGPVDIDLSAAPGSEHISRQHGEIYRESDGRWTVRDLGSTNGVFVKGQGATTFGPRITAPRALTSGDEVAFGNARFVFRTD